MNIKPIETIYKGYRFRSRLEARWAVFFDALGIEYEYEPEGYVVSNGFRYLPDFKLKKYEIFVEIKPSYTNKDYIQNLEEFAYAIDRPLLLICGTPGEQTMELYCFDTSDTGTAGIGWNELPLDESDKVRRKREYYLPNSYAESVGRGILSNFLYDDFILSEQFMYALSKARQARFEFGEAP